MPHHGHLVVYANPDFVAAFGGHCVGMPAREVLVSLPGEAFGLLDAVLHEGRPLARWIVIEGAAWRLTAMPRLDPEAGAPYGVSFHLRRRTDLPILRRARTGPRNRRSPGPDGPGLAR